MVSPASRTDWERLARMAMGSITRPHATVAARASFNAPASLAPRDCARKKSTTSFGEDMGYRVDGRARPGVSVFKRRDGKILRVADTGFEPGDDFCSVWHLFDLIPEGAAGWQPKFGYVPQLR